MTDHNHHHDHEHQGEGEGSYGMALGFRIFEDAGSLYMAEVEITPYVDEPNALGATLVFHPLDGIDPIGGEVEEDWPAWPVDIDDDLTRNPEDSSKAQFAGIARQVGGLSEEQLREYLALAREEAENPGEEE